MRVVGAKAGQAGFTILELMVAASVFAVILLVVAVGVLGFTNSYYKGVTSSKTQAATRSVMATVTQAIQFGKSVGQLPPVGGVQGFCVDNVTYSYRIGQQVTDTAPQGAQHQDYHGLVASSAGCNSPSLPGAGPLLASSRELLGQHMRLSVLDITPQGSLYLVHIKIIYGDDAVLAIQPVPALGDAAWANEKCAGNLVGGQFCAVSDLTTTVEQRLL